MGKQVHRYVIESVLASLADLELTRHLIDVVDGHHRGLALRLFLAIALDEVIHAESQTDTDSRCQHAGQEIRPPCGKRYFLNL